MGCPIQRMSKHTIDAAAYYVQADQPSGPRQDRLGMALAKYSYAAALLLGCFSVCRKETSFAGMAASQLLLSSSCAHQHMRRCISYCSPTAKAIDALCAAPHAASTAVHLFFGPCFTACDCLHQCLGLMQSFIRPYNG